MTEPKEFTGIEGLREALTEPGAWEFDAPHSWSKLSDELEDNIGSKYLAHPCRTWRRIPKPEPVRPTEAELVAALREGKEIRERMPNGDEYPYQVRPVFMIKRGPNWEPCVTNLDSACSNWFSANSRDGRTWTIIDHQPAQPEPAAEMTESDAEKWLLADSSRVAVDREGDAWQVVVGDEGPKYCCTAGVAGMSFIRKGHGPFRPVSLATRAQVELEKELAESRAASKGLEQACDDLRHQLADANATVTILTRDWQPLADWANTHHGSLAGETCATVALKSIKELAEDNATLRDAIGHAVSELSIYDATFPRATNATNWLASALNRTSRSRKP